MRQDSLFKRDAPMQCYVWEYWAFPNSPHCDRQTIETLCKLVHADIIRLIGPESVHCDPAVQFTTRIDEGCAAGKWGSLAFHPDGATLETVLHEIGHSLTWSPIRLHALDRAKTSGRALVGVQRHLDTVLCNEGHGPRFKACLLALMERYAGTCPAEPLRLARDGFKYRDMQAKGNAPAPWRVITADVDLGAFQYWRYLWRK